MNRAYLYTNKSYWKRTKERVLFALLIIPMFLLASLALLLGDIPTTEE